MAMDYLILMVIVAVGLLVALKFMKSIFLSNFIKLVGILLILLIILSFAKSTFSDTTADNKILATGAVILDSFKEKVMPGNDNSKYADELKTLKHDK